MKQRLTWFLLGVIAMYVATEGIRISDVLPDIVPSTAPFETDVPRVLAIYESGETHKLPASQLDVLTGTSFRRWCDENGWEFKSWDEEIPIVQADEAWRKALEVERTDTPWLVFSNGNSGDSIPLPANSDDAIEALKEYTQ